MHRILAALAAAIVLSSFLGSASVADTRKKILMVGDSMFAWNRMKGGGVGRHLQRALGAKVLDRSRSGAGMTTVSKDSGTNKDILAQYRSGDWDWVVINGGANDLMFRCGCSRCGGIMKQVITKDLRHGALAQLISAARADGARIMLVGYHQGYSGGHFFSGCRRPVTELVSRFRELASRNSDIHFVSAREALDANNRTHFALDRVHPSSQGSRLIARHIAGRIAAVRR